MSVHITLIGSDPGDVRKTLRAMGKAFSEACGVKLSRNASNAEIISALKTKFPGCVVNVGA